jgi:general L-amino acid transport system substrate-binding protein
MLMMDTGVYSGLDVEYCRAIAAAIGLNPATDIEYIVASAGDRFQKLTDEEIDVLIRTTTWTTSRDADLNADFAGINFYDGQGILVNADAFTSPTSIMDLDGATVCTTTGTTTEGNLADYFTTNNLDYTVIGVANDAAAKIKFVNEECTAWTGDMSNMVAQQYGVNQDGNTTFNMAIMPELLSKEPLGAATRDNDDDWNDVVTWVWFGMLTAEELGIDSTNYAAADLSNPALGRLLNNTLGLGTDANPLSATWMQDVLKEVGNYYEAYDRSFCDGTGAMANCLVDRAGTMNAPYWEGGLQYAPPMR